MRPLAELEEAARKGLARIEAAPDVEEAEVFVSQNGTLVTRLNYTSHIPSNGVEEPKSVDNIGVGVRAVFRREGGRANGFGSEASDVSLDAVDAALGKARVGAVMDPDFVSLPRSHSATSPTVGEYHDERVMSIEASDLVDAGWRVVEGALDVFESSEELLAEAGGDRNGILELGLILGGDVTMLQERMAIASTHLPKVETDQSTLVMSFITAMIEARDAKGGGWAVGTSLNTDFVAAGRTAARGAIASMGGVRLPAGEYDVVLGPQAVTDIFHHLVLPGLTLDLFYAGATPFAGKVGSPVAGSALSMYDDGAAPGLAATKRVTCEGLPTGRTDLIRNGKLVGLLASYYESERIQRDPLAEQKLGMDPAKLADALVPRNGFRFSRGGGRHFDSSPGTAATNVVIGAADGGGMPGDLLAVVGDGLYIGRIWYTYPVNGFSSGDFTCTVIGDSYVIKDGKLAEPVKPNTLRINHNTLRLLSDVAAIGAEKTGTIVWMSDQITYAPDLAVRRVNFDEIAEFMDNV